MKETPMSLTRFKREIATILNRVASGSERIVLTSRGKPKAAIVSLEDYGQIQYQDLQAQADQWEHWLAANKKLSNEILTTREGETIDIDTILAGARSVLEEQHDNLSQD
jgi:prevent-host-death family protein